MTSALLTELLAKRRRLDERIQAEVARLKKDDVSPDVVVEIAARIMDVPRSAITSRQRQRTLVRARWVAAKVMRDSLFLSTPKIAEALGCRDHTTIMHGLRSIERHPYLVDAAALVRRELLGAQ